MHECICKSNNVAIMDDLSVMWFKSPNVLVVDNEYARCSYVTTECPLCGKNVGVPIEQFTERSQLDIEAVVKRCREYMRGVSAYRLTSSLGNTEQAVDDDGNVVRLNG